MGLHLCRSAAPTDRDNDRLQTIHNRLYQFLNFTGRWDDWLWLSEQAEASALAADNKENAGWMAFWLGWIHTLRRQPAEVLTCATRAAEHWQDSTPRNKSFAIQLRGAGYELQKDYPAAIAAYREMLEVDRAISSEGKDFATDLNELANAERANKDYSAAEQDYREALRISKIIKDDGGTAIYTSNLAGLALIREQWAEAESLAREAHALAEKVGRQELIAYDCDILAKALLKQYEEATLSRHRGARPVPPCRRDFHAPAFTGDVQSAQETLAEIEEAVG